MESGRSYRVGPPEQNPRAPYEFPEAGEFVIYSRPEFYVQLDQRSELVRCAGQIRLRTSEPVMNSDGLRRVPVEVLEWEAVGQSEILGGELRFAATESLESCVSAGSERADLPGRLVLAIMSSTHVNGRQIDSHRGRAEGLISAFPPAPGDLFALDAPSPEVDLASLTAGALTGSLRITASTCKCAD